MINQKLSELNAFEERLKKKELELEKREQELNKVLLGYPQELAPTIVMNHPPQEEINNNIETITANVFSVTEFDSEYTSNKLELLNENRIIQKIYNDDWSCACLGLVPEDINVDIVKFQIKLINNYWNNLFVGFAFKEDFYLSGKNYSVCAYMIYLCKKDKEIKLLKYCPKNETGCEIETNFAINNIQALELIHNKTLGKIDLVLNRDTFSIFEDIQLKGVTLHPAFEVSKFQSCVEFIK